MKAIKRAAVGGSGELPGLISAAAFLVVVASIAIAFGLGSRLTPRVRELHYLAWSIVMIGGMVGLLPGAIGQRPIDTIEILCRNGSDSYLVVLFGFIFVLFYFMLPAWLSIALAVALGVTSTALYFRSRYPSRPFAIFISAALVAMIYAVDRMNRGPDDPGMDLLPITRAAIHFAMQGFDPYQADYTHITPNPFFYLPLQWMTYAPFEIMGINLRWVNFVCWLMIIIVFEWTVAKATNRPLARLVFYPVMVSFPVYQAMDTQVLPMWLGTVCFMAALLRGYLLVASLLLGWLVANNQMMIAVAGLSSVYFFRVLPLQQFIRCSMIVAGVVMLAIGPFILLSPDFLSNVLIVRPRMANLTWESARNAYNSVGINNILFHLGFEDKRLILQLGVLAAGAVAIMLRPPRDISQFLYAAGSIFLIAIALNGQILRYYYYPALLMISWGFIAFPDRRDARALVRPRTGRA